jgi:hypothetical protein
MELSIFLYLMVYIIYVVFKLLVYYFYIIYITYIFSVYVYNLHAGVEHFQSQFWV